MTKFLHLSGGIAPSTFFSLVPLWAGILYSCCTAVVWELPFAIIQGIPFTSFLHESPAS